MTPVCPPRPKTDIGGGAEDHSWRTNFPPPDGFNGYEEGIYGDADYSRQCKPQERSLLDRRFPDAFADEKEDERRADEADRDSYFAALAGDMDAGEANGSIKGIDEKEVE